MSLVAQLGPTALKTVGGLGAVLLGGRLLMRRCAAARPGPGCCRMRGGATGPWLLRCASAPAELATVGSHHGAAFQPAHRGLPLSQLS